jgi:uncharacterized protein involved in exopolysaccharide biosynthesis
MAQTVGGAVERVWSGDVSPMATAIVLLRARRIIVRLAVLGALIGLVSGLLRHRTYLTRVTFLPKGAEESASSLALAASQFGLSLPTNSGEWWPAIYVEVLNSRSLLEPIVNDTFSVTEENGRRATMLELMKVRGATAEVRTARGIIALRRLIIATEDKKLGAVRVSAVTRWPSVSQALAEKLVDGVNQFNIEARRTLAAAERQFADTQAQEAERELRRAEDKLQSFLMRNRVLAAPDLTFQRDRLQRDVSIWMQTYTSLLQSREQARLREVRNTPVITMIEGPRLPVLPEKRGLGLRAVLGFLTGILLGSLWVFGVRGLGAVRQAPDPQGAELVALLQEATPRLLRRWVGL